MISAVDAFSQSPNDSSMRGIVDQALGGNMKNDDIARLALVLGKSGDYQSRKMGSVSADLASTGGPSSLSTLLGPVYLCSMNNCVPKLGVPGRPAGGVDTLAQIPGYRVNLSSNEVLDCIEECGYAHFLAGSGHAPLDALLFRFRQSVGAQNVPDLAIASILAKKVAVGLERAGLDIRVAPHGNFGATWEEARNNGQRFCEVAEILGISSVCVLTDGTIPYQRFLGRGESLLALRHLFLGTADSSLLSHAMQCLGMASAIASPDALTLAAAIKNASMCFFRNLRAQGSSREAFEDYASRVERGQKLHLIASSTGFVHVDLERLRSVIVAYQGLGAPDDSLFPDEMGLVLQKMPGSFVQTGEVLATVRIAEQLWVTAQSKLVKAIEVRSSMTRGSGYEVVGNG